MSVTSTIPRQATGDASIVMQSDKSEVPPIEGSANVSAGNISTEQPANGSNDLPPDGPPAEHWTLEQLNAYAKGQIVAGDGFEAEQLQLEARLAVVKPGGTIAYFRAGRALTIARTKLKHGQWGKWLTAHGWKGRKTYNVAIGIYEGAKTEAEAGKYSLKEAKELWSYKDPSNNPPLTDTSVTSTRRGSHRNNRAGEVSTGLVLTPDADEEETEEGDEVEDVLSTSTETSTDTEAPDERMTIKIRNQSQVLRDSLTTEGVGSIPPLRIASALITISVDKQIKLEGDELAEAVRWLDAIRNGVASLRKLYGLDTNGYGVKTSVPARSDDVVPGAGEIQAS